MKVNIKTIAEKSGVSVATVSRVINQNGRFSAETEATVRRVMKELDYHPNTVAKSLRENHSKVIGVIVPDITNPHFAGLVLEIEKYLFQHSFSTVICNTNESAKLEQQHVDTLISQRVSGIIFISGVKHYNLEDIAVVYVDRRPAHYDEKRDCLVESDNESGGYLATKRLIELGCKNIAMMCSYETDFNHKMRYRGYQKAMVENGRKETVLNVSVVSALMAAAVIEEYIDRGESFDGLVCTTDFLAVGAIIGLRKRGISVPAQIKVTGFDDSMIASLYHPSISTLRQPVSELARKSADLLLEQIKGHSPKHLHEVLPVEFVERNTTKALGQK